jgi:putative phage-type endonuclease
MDKKELEIRQSGIGASEASAALGLSKWKTPLQLWEEKTNPVVESEETKVQTRGKLFEPVIRQIYSNETGRIVKVVPTIRSEKYPFMFASPDGYVDSGRYVEIKTARNRQEWGEPGTDEIPLAYMIQVQHGLIVTALPVADIPVAFSMDDIAIYEVPADKELQEMIIEKEAAFWARVKNVTPPDPINYQDVVRMFRQSKPETVSAPLEIQGKIIALKSLKENFDKLKQFEEEYKSTVMKFMQDKDTLVDADGVVIATWKTQHKKAYAVKESTSRVFRLKGE